MNLGTQELWAGLTRLSRGGQQRFLRAANQIDWTRDSDEVRPALVKLMETVTTAHGRAAERFAVDVYNDLRAQHIGLAEYAARTFDSLPARDVVRNQVGAAIRHATRGKPQATVRELAQNVENAIRNAAQTNLLRNAGLDPKAPRFEVTLEPDPCTYCQQQALRIEADDFVKRWGGTSNGAWFHPECRCTVTPTWEPRPQPRLCDQR